MSPLTTGIREGVAFVLPPMPTHESPTHERTRTIDLSVPQLVGGSVAAATAAALSDRLGLLGSIVGAAFASVVSAVVAASLAGWLHRARDLAVRRETVAQGRLRSAAVGALALGLVAVAFHTGLDLLLRDLPSDTFAARLLLEMGLGQKSA
ncbi:hypothetical protein GCM10009623_09760 [Nocardioides aestuarii]